MALVSIVSLMTQYCVTCAAATIDTPLSPLVHWPHAPAHTLPVFPHTAYAYAVL